MHMSDALLSPAVGTTFWAASSGVIAYCARRLKDGLDDKTIPLMGVLGAFIFAAQMINFTIPGTGSSGHIGGGMILAILVGPYPAFIVIASVLMVQSLFFADGGILALGCNIWNLGFYPCFIAYPLIYRQVVRRSKTPRRVMVASVLSVVLALELGALSVVFQTLLSDRAELPFVTFAALMLPIHLAIAIVEGIITGGFVNYVQRLRPEVMEIADRQRNIITGLSIKRVIISIAILAILTGGIISWFASTHPDGLEWSIEKIYGKAEVPEPQEGVIFELKDIQQKTAILPDYNLAMSYSGKSPVVEKSWPSINAGTSVSGLIGSVMVMGIIVIMGLGIRVMRR